MLVGQVEIEEPGGVELYRSIPKSFYRSADGIVLMYSREASCSFEGLSYILLEAASNMEFSRKTVWALFGNKCDLPMAVDKLEDRVEELSERLHKQTTARLGIHCAVSAKTGKNLSQALDRVVAEMHRMHSNGTQPQPQAPALDKHKPDPENTIRLEPMVLVHDEVDTNQQTPLRRFRC